MPNDTPAAVKAHTELRRQDHPDHPDHPDQGRPTEAEAEAEAKSKMDAPQVKPRVPQDRLPAGDDDDLFNDMPV